MNDEILNTFIQKNGSVNRMLHLLLNESTDHFSVPIETVQWSHVTNLAYVEKCLTEICEFLGYDIIGEDAE